MRIHLFFIFPVAICRLQMPILPLEAAFYGHFSNDRSATLLIFAAIPLIIASHYYFCHKIFRDVMGLLPFNNSPSIASFVLGAIPLSELPITPIYFAFRLIERSYSPRFLFHFLATLSKSIRTMLKPRLASSLRYISSPRFLCRFQLSSGSAINRWLSICPKKA